MSVPDRYKGKTAGTMSWTMDKCLDRDLLPDWLPEAKKAVQAIHPTGEIFVHATLDKQIIMQMLQQEGKRCVKVSALMFFGASMDRDRKGR